MQRMSQAIDCLECGLPLPPFWPKGLCACCALRGILDLPEEGVELGRDDDGPSSSEDQCGRYRLLEKLGEGGFGAVWMAEQREPVKRLIALKILKLGMDTKQVIARF